MNAVGRKKITDNKKRIFFALWPNELTRKELIKVYNLRSFSRLEGKKYESKNLHLTLHFLGNATEKQLNCALTAAAQLNFKSFNLSLDYFDIFKKPKVLWMGCLDKSLELQSLHKKLGHSLNTCGFVLDNREFTPHVSLMRKLNQFEFNEKSPVINWQVNEFALVESVASENGVIYKPIKFFGCSA